ncbi:MAG: hypothetical protein AB8G11_21085 [Saprospiraceae bacterium]
MKRLFNLLICLLIWNISNAQIETTNWLYTLGGEMPKELEFENQGETKVLKILNNSRYIYPNAILVKTLNDAISNGELTIYKEKMCKNSISKEAAEKLLIDLQADTIIIFNPEIFDERMTVYKAYGGFLGFNKTVCEMEQDWKYNNITKQLEMDLKAIHIYSLKRKDNSEEFLNIEAKKYLFSIKNNGKKVTNATAELKKMNVIWAAEFTYTDVFKNEKLRKVLLSKSHQKAHKVISALDRKTILTDHEIEEISTGFVSDTVITFDPETFDEHINISSTKLYYGENHIRTFQVVQDFYFDIETNSFNTRILGIAPVRKMYDDRGDFKYQYSMFWIVYDDDFLK